MLVSKQGINVRSLFYDERILLESEIRHLQRKKRQCSISENDFFF